MARIKSSAVAVAVPNDHEEARAMLRRIGEAQRQRDRIQSDLNDTVSQLQESAANRAAPFNDQIRNYTAGLQIWAEANRAELTGNGKRKSMDMGVGELGWRTRPPRVSVRGIDVVIGALRSLGLTRFLREKVEINKEAVLAEPEAVEHIKGISITQGEDFWIKPAETDLEEVA